MQTDADWSAWMPIVYHDEHGPDPGSEEARHARPGTDELLVGEVDQVQVRVTTKSAAPADLKLAVIDPGLPTDDHHRDPRARHQRRVRRRLGARAR